ncbi:7409_t:CDS:2 [Entrophospora sp. SA101]|nr:7409_t:CDS:2 [Entrophospora sp. SA101]
MPEVGVYPSQEINAFATGPAGNTLIAFSSGLVNIMSPEEIRGVVVVDGVDLTEDENVQQGEPNSIALLKFNPEKKKRGLLDLFRTHPTLEERIERLEKLKKQQKLLGIV